MAKGGWVYILASQSDVLYVGVTSDILGRVAQHRDGVGCAFTARYKCDRLVYFEGFPTIVEAIAREKQIKAWRRSKKLELIATRNPGWVDLFPGFTGQAGDDWRIDLDE